MRKRTEAGMSLVEIVIAIVILGAVVSALVASLATAATASRNHRNLVTADAVLRDYAEAVKSAVRTSCTTAGASWTATTTPPPGFTVNALGVQACPGAGAVTLPTVHLTVQLPNGTSKALDIMVRAS